MIYKRNDELFGSVQNFSHEDSSIFGINGEKFINFTSFINNFDLDRIDDEICYVLSKADLSVLPKVAGNMPPKLRERDYSGMYFENDIQYYFDNIPNSEYHRKVMKDMTLQEQRRYMLFKLKSLLPWFFVYTIKPNKFITKSQDLYPWNESSNQMPYTTEAIKHLPLEEIGRVVIYGSWPGVGVPPHRDSPKSDDNHLDHHININPGSYRPVYLYDSYEDKKYFLPKDHRCYAFNVSDYHGVDPLPHFSYTLRVDGKYNKEALQHAGITE